MFFVHNPFIIFIKNIFTNRSASKYSFLLQIFELMGDNREKDKEASKNLTSDAESDILKKIDLAFQVTISFTCPKTMIVI